MPNHHFSLEHIAKRRPAAIPDRQIHRVPFDSGFSEGISHPLRVGVGVFHHEVVRESSVVEKSLREQRLKDFLGYVSELFRQLLNQLPLRVVLTSKQLESMMVDLVHDRLS